MDLDVLKVAVVPPICCWSGWKVAASVLSFDSEWENTPRETASRLEDDEQERQGSNFCRMVWCNTCSRNDLTANSLLRWVCRAAWERPRFNETWLDIRRLEWAWIFSRPSYYFDIILQKQYPVVLLETLENHKCSQSFIRPIWLLHEADLVLQEVCSAVGNCRILPHGPVTKCASMPVYSIEIPWVLPKHCKNGQWRVIKVPWRKLWWFSHICQGFGILLALSSTNDSSQSKGDISDATWCHVMPSSLVILSFLGMYPFQPRGL